MVDYGKKIKFAGVAVAVILVISLGVSLVLAWGPSWLNRDKESTSTAQAQLLSYENGEVVSSDIDILEDYLDNADKPVFIDFWAAWCGPCREAAPFVEGLAEEYDDKAYVVKVNIDEQQAIANAYSIRSIPTFIVVDQGQITGVKLGYAVQMQDELRDLINQRLAG